ncbi:hypothetical protein BV898_15572 [Hypsibius exemplaris]|uniref:Uncharacterized protein n=1 Tax=Hypsibius exemplaris TaxID=2072580 RepID=A0A9X6NBS2_HYPEX|nr:hypothetical protein BV898_15572 [Hypsibius exemplaris]
MFDRPIVTDEYVETMELRTQSTLTSIVLLRLQLSLLGQTVTAAALQIESSPQGNLSFSENLQPMFLSRSKRDASSSSSEEYAFRSHHRRSPHRRRHYHRFIPFHNHGRANGEQALFAIFKLLSRPPRRPTRPVAKPGKPTNDGPPAENEPSDPSAGDVEYRPEEDPTLLDPLGGGTGTFDWSGLFG